MRIGKVATECAVSVQTVRFYEKKGLLKRPRRLSSGYRDYPAETVRIIQFIKRSQQSGFTLNEIRAQLQAMARGAPGALNRRADIENKIDAIDQQIRSLEAIRSDLKSCLESCICSDGVSPCPGAYSVSAALRS